MVVLARIDQRLIHGLVVNQWAPALKVKRFMVVDDVLCNNEDIKASMRMAKPAHRSIRNLYRDRDHKLQCRKVRRTECTGTRKRA